MSDVEVEKSTGNSFLDDLLGFIDEQEVEELGLNTADDTYVIRDMNHANYIAKKLKEVRKEMSDINEAADTQIQSYTEKVNAWKEKVTTPLQNTETYLIGLLEEYARRQLEGSSKKSIKLIEGTVQFRKQPDKFEYNDEVLLAYLQTDLPSYVKQKPQIDKAELKKAGAIKEGNLVVAGKVIPGIIITPQEEKFEVK